ncbi:MAG: DUF2769 domain-containing protein [Alphaproteobacteria bacterium]|nr:DUF2769 domain-containing protein [Alphaproteobacteria bacterium]
MQQKVEKTEQNIERCLCLNCPSYSSSCKIKNAHQTTNQPSADLLWRTHYEKMFCAFEKSNCIHADKGCICDKCANFRDYNLKNCTYCIHTGGTN